MKNTFAYLSCEASDLARIQAHGAATLPKNIFKPKEQDKKAVAKYQVMDNFNQERFRWESATTFAAAKKMSNSLRAVTPTPTSCSASITSSKTSPSTISSTSGADTPVPTIRARTAKPSTTSLHMNAFPTALSGLPPKDIPQVIAKQTARTESKLQKKKSESEGLVAGATSLVTLGAGGMARMGAIVEAFELGERILMWKDASLSSIVLITFFVCCAYPIIILILPQLILSLYILYRYISKAPPLAPPPPVQSDLMTVMDILGSEKYNRYLSFVQNQMTLFCESMDSLATFHETYFTWRNPSKTSMFLKGVVVAIPVTLLGAFIVPFWLVRLVIGVCGAWVLCRETWICTMLVDVMPKVLWRRGVMVGESVVKGMPLPDSVTDSLGEYSTRREGKGSNVIGDDNEMNREEIEPKVVMVEVFENQRWWAGAGWTSTMLGEERSSWSDDSGLAKLHEKSADSIPPLANHIWVDDDWVLDTEWAATDSEGWVFTDHNWTNPSKISGITSLTRRRRWIRGMKEVPVIQKPLPSDEGGNSGLRKMSVMTSWSAWTNRGSDLDDEGMKKKRLSSWLTRDSVMSSGIGGGGLRKRSTAQ